jgi:internalin A
MPRSLLGELFRYLRRESAVAGQELSDGALLERFLDQRDEVAFENLVQRHGPMVLGVCRRVVGDTHAAEDAFQATFFVLARKAGSIRNQASVGSWLFGVAQRIASKARARAATRRDRERRAAVMPHTEKLDELTWQELRSILDEEIGRLPAKYQAVVVLCHLEGKSYDQAAQELGCPKSTLATRLAKALELLRSQLTRRGLTLSAGALAAAVTEKATAAPVAALLSINIMKAAASVAAGKPLAAGILSTKAIALAEEAMKTMIGIKMKLVVLVLALGLTVGVGYAGFSAWMEQSPPKLEQPPVAKEQPAKKDPAGPAKLLPDAWLNVGPANFAAFLPDGKQIVTASSDGNIRVWEYPAGKEIRRIAMPEDSAKGKLVALSTDGKIIATAKDDETEIYLLDLLTGKQLPVLKWAAPEEKRRGRGSVNSQLAFSPNGEHLAAMDHAGVVSIWDWSKGKEIRKFPTTDRENFGGKGLAYAPDGRSILTIVGSYQLGNDGFVKIWDPATGKEERTLYGSANVPRGTPRSSTVIAVSFSPDSKNVAIGTIDGIVIVDTATGNQRRKLTTEHVSKYISGGLAFGKDGAKLYHRIPDEIVEYEVATGKVLRRHQLRAGHISLSPDGNTLLAAGSRPRFLDLSDKEIASLLDDAALVSAEAHAYAVQLVEKYGGKVLRDDKQPGEPVIAVNLSRAPFPGGKKGGGTGFTRGDGAGGLPASWPSDLLKELKQFKQLASLDLSGRGGVSGRGFSELKELKQLTTLDLGRTQVTNEGLSELKELKLLKELDLGATKVTDEGLKELKELEQLTKLNLGGTKVTDAGLKELKELKQLTSLDLSRCPGVNGVGLSALKELKQLTMVDLSFSSVTDAGVKDLKELKQLTTLGLRATKVTDAGLKELQEALPMCKISSKADEADVAKLVEKLGGTITRDDTQPGNPVIAVNLARNKGATDANLKGLKEFKQLATLDLKFTPVTDAGLKELKELKQLANLYLGGTQVTDEGLKELKELKQLTTLGLGDTAVTGVGLKELKELKQLKELILGRGVTDAGVKELTELPELTKLAIYEAQVTDASLKGLKELKQLKELKLSACKNVTDEGLKELKELKQLTSLSLAGCRNVTDAGVRELQEALPKCKIKR